eukprot:601247-Pelagomonas_calceolata.AAC.2
MEFRNARHAPASTLRENDGMPLRTRTIAAHINPRLAFFEDLIRVPGGSITRCQTKCSYL